MSGSKQNPRTKLEGLLSIDTTKLNKGGYFVGYKLGNLSWDHDSCQRNNSIGIVVDLRDQPYIRIWYTSSDTYDGVTKNFDYNVLLSSTPCHFGGIRWWFICPIYINGIACGRRVRKLYKLKDYFACRECHNLCYSIQNENHRWEMNGLLKTFRYSLRSNTLMDEISIYIYNGKITRKMQRFISLEQQANDSFENWKKQNDIKGKGI
jgi:hypothetical protein